MITLSGGRRAFAKAVLPGPAIADGAAPAGGGEQVAAAFAAEANGLRWLAEAGAVPVPEVLAVAPSALVISMIPPGRATPEAAFGFGADLARLHAAGAERFGAPWRGFIAGLPLDNTVLARGATPRNPPRTGGLPAPPYPLGPPRPPGHSGTPPTGCCRTCGWPWTPARSGRKTGASWRRSPTGSAHWPGPPSRRAGSTATAGPGTCCGPAAGAGSSTRRRTAGTARPTWPCWPCSARPAWTGSSRGTTTRFRWRPAGGRGSRSTSCTRCWCTRACSGPRTGTGFCSAARAALAG